MRRFSFVVVSTLALLAGRAQAVEVLLNGNLDDPGINEGDTAVSWTLGEFLGAANTPMQNTATFVEFADHTAPGPGGVGLWLRSFEGLFSGSGNEPADAILSQIVPGQPGATYTFSGWSYWETGYSGGVPSSTGTFFEMRFLDAALAGISGVLLDLRTVQQNDLTWRQHSLMGIAPAGTASVLVTAYALDMLPSTTNPQSAFFDDFSLDCADCNHVPEPSTAVLGWIAVLGLARAVRRRR